MSIPLTIALITLFIVQKVNSSLEIKSNLEINVPIGRCNIANIEKNCELGATYCLFEDVEFCSKCLSGTILASPFKNNYRCVNINMTLCANDSKCNECNQHGQCVLCTDPNSNLITSYEGSCVDTTTTTISCKDANCVSCLDSGKTCIYCKNNFVLNKDGICVESNNGCAKLDSTGNYCSRCHLGYLMNYNYIGCRPYQKSKT